MSRPVIYHLPICHLRWYPSTFWLAWICDDHVAIQFQRGKVSHDMDSEFLQSVGLANFHGEMTVFAGKEASCLSRSRRSSATIAWNLEQKFWCFVVCCAFLAEVALKKRRPLAMEASWWMLLLYEQSSPWNWPLLQSLPPLRCRKPWTSTTFLWSKKSQLSMKSFWATQLDLTLSV